MWKRAASYEWERFDEITEWLWKFFDKKTDSL